MEDVENGAGCPTFSSWHPFVSWLSVRATTERFISVDICSESLNRFRNSDLVLKKILRFVRENVS